MMNRWKIYKLSDIADVQTGPFGSQLHQRDYVDVGTPCIMPCNIGANLDVQTDNIAHLKASDIIRLNKYCVKEGDIIYSRRGDIEKCAYINHLQEGWLCGTGCLRIRPNTSICFPKYLAYLLSTKESKKWIVANAVGTTMLNLNSSILNTMPVSFPPLAEQKRIADILSAIDDKIELNRRINANLEQQAQALYKSWFVDNKKDDWEEGVASDYYNITIGKTPPRKETKWFSTDKKDHVWISISDMGKHGMYLGQSSEYLTQSAIENFSIVIVPDKTVLLSFKLTIGRVVISDGNVTTNEAIAHFNTNDQNLLEYTYLSLKNYEFAALGSTSSIATAVNSKTIKSMRWIMPNRDLINQFHEKVGPLFNMIKQNEKEINYLSTLRDTLLPKLMSGEITI